MSMRVMQHLRRLVALMERCEPEVPAEQRATDEEWIHALAAARRFIATENKGTSRRSALPSMTKQRRR